jgi:hypothetical protein
VFLLQPAWPVVIVVQQWKTGVNHIITIIVISLQLLHRVGHPFAFALSS